MRKRTIAAAVVGVLLGAQGMVLAGCATETRAGYDERLAAWRQDASQAAPEDGAVVDAEKEDEERLFGDAEVLEQRALVAAVLRRSPTVASARQAWRAALEEVPQVTSFEDPMLAYEVAPLSVPLPISGRDVPFGNSVMLSQRLPFPGKLEAEGALALSSADVVEHELRATRLSLALLSSQLWADYFATARSLTVNEELSAVLLSLRESAEAHLATGHALLRDPLRAEVSLAHLEHDRVVLEARRRVLIARLNGLLHRAPDAALPPPPAEVALPDVIVNDNDEQDLQARALEERPEVAAAQARIGGAEAGLDLAGLSYAPDVSVSGQYTSMFPLLEHQWMLGASLSLPLQLGRRDAERDEAKARMSRARSEHARVIDDVRTEVAVARERAREARHVVTLYEDRLIPVARGQLEAARASLEAGTRGYVDVLESEEDLRRVRLAREVAIADLLKRRAELERALGRTPGIDEDVSGGQR